MVPQGGERTEKLSSYKFPYFELQEVCELPAELQMDIYVGRPPAYTEPAPHSSRVLLVQSP
jgi:hypothetical protein